AIAGEPDTQTIRLLVLRNFNRARNGKAVLSAHSYLDAPVLARRDAERRGGVGGVCAGKERCPVSPLRRRRFLLWPCAEPVWFGQKGPHGVISGRHFSVEPERAVVAGTACCEHAPGRKNSRRLNHVAGDRPSGITVHEADGQMPRRHHLEIAIRRTT